MTLVDNVKDCWRWFSVQFPVINLAFLGTWGALPEKFQDALPPSIVLVVSGLLIVAGVAGRLIKQPEVKP